MLVVIKMCQGCVCEFNIYVIFNGMSVVLIYIFQGSLYLVLIYWVRF